MPPDSLTWPALIISIAIGLWNIFQRLAEKSGGKLIDNWTESAKADREIAQAQAQAAIQDKIDQREQSQTVQLQAFESSNKTMAALLEELKASNEFLRLIVEEKTSGLETTMIRIHTRLDKIEIAAEQERQQTGGQVRMIIEGHQESLGEIQITLAALAEKMNAWTEAINFLAKQT